MGTLDKLGRGWSVPVLPDRETRALTMVSGAATVRQSILVILETEPGERLMRPTFGAGLRRYLMKPNTVATRAQIQRDVTNSLLQWEPRIELSRVQVLPGSDPSEIRITIDYLHKRDGSAANLVYPFYLE